MYDKQNAPLDHLFAMAARPRVLLAEDDDELRPVLETALTRAGFEVSAVPDGSELLDRIALCLLGDRWEPMPDVIVTDVRLPAFNGLSLMEGLREEGFRVPVVVITAFGDQMLRDRVENMGRATYLDKPFEQQELEAAVWRAYRR